MKKTSWVAAVVASFLLLSLTACDALLGGTKTKSGSSSSSSNTNVDDEITGPLTTVETWPGKDSEGNSITYYINSNYAIKNGGNLTIEEGAIVKFGPSGKITVNNTGALTATGTKFTSYRDTEGRTISISGGVDPAPGDWKQIYIYGGTSKFTKCYFYYGGNNCNTVEVAKYTTLGKARIDDCYFRHNSGTSSVDYTAKAALKYTLDVEYDEEDNCVTNTVFEDNVWPLSIPVNFSLDDSNSFGTTEETKNKYNYVLINSSTVKTNVEWAKQDVPYLYVLTSVLNINKSSKLTITGGEDEENPAVVCFATKGIDIDEGGELAVNNYVTFTNSPESSATKYLGIYLYWYHTYHKAGSVGNPIVQKVILLDSEDGKIKIKNYKPDNDNYIEEKNDYFSEYSKRITNSNVGTKNPD